MAEKTVTISVRSMLLAALVLLTLLCAYLAGAAGGSGSPARAAAPAAAPGDPHTLRMFGTGDVTAVPDQLSFDLAVVLTRPDLETALDDASRQTNRVLAALEGLGIKRSDVRTTGLSMYPVYDYHPYSSPTLRGYRVTQRAAVLVRELKSGGRAVSTAVATGGNDVRVSNIRLRVGDVDGVLARARTAAVQDARVKAQQYAAAAGLDLGDVVTLHEIGHRARVELQHGQLLNGFRAATADTATVPVPIRAGKDSTKVSVQVVWELG